MIDEKLFIDLRQYILSKTGKVYFGRIKSTKDDLMISCPFHKEGQERKPSCGIKIRTDNKGTAGTVHCFSCGVTTNISLMMQDILGSLYNEDEVESRFNLKGEMGNSFIQQKENLPTFQIPKKPNVQEKQLRTYRIYHPYLQSRGITEEVAKKYDIGYDEFNKQITFPIRNINKECIAIGRRSITYKRYIYPEDMVKPLYGLYELPKFLRYVYVVEGPFNLWSLSGWGKQGVALLGTGTEFQYKQLLQLNCEGFVLALDPDTAGRNGTRKLIKLLKPLHKYKLYVCNLPEGKDINDLSETEFMNTPVLTANEWLYLYGVNITK